MQNQVNVVNTDVFVFERYSTITITILFLMCFKIDKDRENKPRNFYLL